MSTNTQQKIYFIENEKGQSVRALEWDSNELNFIFRHDTKRMESVFDLKTLKDQGIPFTLLETVEKQYFNLKKRYPIRCLTGELSLVAESHEVSTNVDLTSTESDEFISILKHTGIGASLVACFLFGLSFFIGITTETKEELQIVQVLDRKQIEKPLVVLPSNRPVAAANKSVANKKITKVSRKTVTRQFIRSRQRPTQVSQLGALGVLGHMKTSKQNGGLKLDQAQTTAGIGRGGSAGSGGIQTSIYSKGMFSAPLGQGNRASGAGGYVSKGKGGGRAGYGKVTLVGTNSTSFFEPIENETWSDGGLDRNAIAAVIFRHLSEVRFCYEQGLQKTPNLSGRVSMNFMIGANGSVTTAQVNNSSLGHAPVERCIRDHLKTWKFPQPQGGVNVKVSYPFVLRRVSDS